MDGGEVDKRVFENFLLESTDVGFPIDVIGHSLEVIVIEGGAGNNEEDQCEEGRANYTEDIRSSALFVWHWALAEPCHIFSVGSCIHLNNF